MFGEFHDKIAEDPGEIDNKREMKLAIELADILDELKIVMSLLEKQNNLVDTVMDTVRETDKQYGYEQCRDAKEHLENARSNVQEIKDEAGETYKSVRPSGLIVPTKCLPKFEVLELLDLKSKLASLAEAHETTKQGRAVMLFTVVTIIFASPTLRTFITSANTTQLPLSFFTSYFGQNISSLKDNPPAWNLWRVASESPILPPGFIIDKLPQLRSPSLLSSLRSL